MLSCEMSGGHRKEASIRSWEEEDVHIGPGATNPAMMFFFINDHIFLGKYHLRQHNCTQHRGTNVLSQSK